MEESSDIRECPDVLAKERDSHDLVKRILKLRWIGMDVEVEQMQVALRRVEPKVILLAEPRDTD